MNAYQSYETEHITAYQTLPLLLGAFADIQNAYQNVNNMVNAASSNQNTVNNAATKPDTSIAKGISSHTISSAGVIKTGSSDFFLYLLKRPGNFFCLLILPYKDLNYSLAMPRKLQKKLNENK